MQSHLSHARKLAHIAHCHRYPPSAHPSVLRAFDMRDLEAVSRYPVAISAAGGGGVRCDIERDDYLMDDWVVASPEQQSRMILLACTNDTEATVSGGEDRSHPTT